MNLLHSLHVPTPSIGLPTAPQGLADTLLTLYLYLGSAREAAAAANAHGWRLPSKRGADHPPRRIDPTDVYALIRGEPCAVPGTPTPALAATVRLHLERGNANAAVSLALLGLTLQEAPA